MLMVAQSSRALDSRQMSSASSIWQDLLLMRGRVSRAFGHGGHHPRARLISVRTSMGFYGSKSGSFTRLSVMISKTEQNRWYGRLRRSPQRRDASKKSRDHRPGK